MKIVNSFDLFDTLIGRKVNNQLEIFKSCEILNNLLNFSTVRFDAENKAKENNIYYNLLQIYKYIQENYKLSYSQTIKCMNIELGVEYDNVYPIYLNINKLNNDSIIIAETYYTAEQIKKLLSKFNIIDIPIYTSNESNASKSNGSIYEVLKKNYKIKFHTGSNYLLDQQMSASTKISSIHYNYKYHPTTLQIESKLTSYTKDYFKMIESSCKNIQQEHIWNLQLYYNIPLLILFSNILLDFCKEKGIKEVIFINRNCILFKKIFLKINETKNVDIITSDLVLSYKLLENKKYLQKIIFNYNNQTKYLIIDLHDGFTSFLNETFKTIYNIEPMFYCIFNVNLNQSAYQNCYSLYKNDPSLSRLVELLNLPDIGEPIDYVNNIIKYDNFEYDIVIPSIYNAIITEVINTLDDRVISDLNQNLLVEFLQNLTNIKSKIKETSEYRSLRAIYISSDQYYLKHDYYIKPKVVAKRNIDGQINQAVKYLIGHK